MIASHLLDSAAVFVTATAFARYVLPALEAWHYWIATRRDFLNRMARAQARELHSDKLRSRFP